MKISRNAPCPCGSGKKYKVCCLRKDQGDNVVPFPGFKGAGDLPGRGDNTASPDSGNPARSVNEALRAAAEGQQFGSLDELQAFAGSFMAQRNSQALDDFDGLSPEQMAVLLDQPVMGGGASGFITQSIPTDVSNVPVMQLLSMLIEAIGEKGLKPTATGNLPRNLCREIAEQHWGSEGYANKTRYSGINTEPDFHPLHVCRINAEMAGLMHKYKGKFVLTQRASDLLGRSGLPGMYPEMIHAFTEKYNWGYGDGYPELPFMNRSWRFTVWLLQRYGDAGKTGDFYAGKYATAFPALLDEIANDDSQWVRDHVDETLKNAYKARALTGFAEFFGLAVCRKLDDKGLFSDVSVKAGPMLGCWQFAK